MKWRLLFVAAILAVLAWLAVRWTQSVLTEEEFVWLRELPLVTHLEHCSVAHGTYHKPELFDYIQSTSDADPSLDAMCKPVCFVGHTHVPVTLLRLEDDPTNTAYTLDTEIDLSEARRWFTHLAERAGWNPADLVHDASADSFPASDAPAWTPTVGTGLSGRARGR